MQTTSPSRAIGLAWIVAGCLDITSAIVIWLIRGVPLVKGFQGIAMGLVGRESAFQGGLATAALGLALHFFIMLCVVIIYFMASRVLAMLTRCPIRSGALYGIIVYLVMYWIVVPVSRIGPRPHSVSNDTIAILVHICLIGLPIALIMHRLSPAQSHPNHE
jgi:uncharacterized membrane protein YagU involved in acid resistance